MLKSHVTDILNLYHSKLERKARTALLNKELKIKQSCSTTCEFTVGMEVAYNGHVYKVMDIYASQPGETTSVKIQRELINGSQEVKKVQHSQLLPLADPKHVHHCPLDILHPTSSSSENFVIFQIGALVYSGLIISEADGELTIHEFEPSPTQKSWLPLWDDMGKRKRVKEKPSLAATAVTHSIKEKAILARGSYDEETHTVNETLRIAYKKSNVACNRELFADKENKDPALPDAGKRLYAVAKKWEQRQNMSRIVRKLREMAQLDEQRQLQLLVSRNSMKCFPARRANPDPPRSTVSREIRSHIPQTGRLPENRVNTSVPQSSVDQVICDGLYETMVW